MTTQPEKTSAGDHVHGNGLPADAYEVSTGRYDGTTAGQQPVADEREWMERKASAPEITQGAGSGQSSG